MRIGSRRRPAHLGPVVMLVLLAFSAPAVALRLLDVAHDALEVVTGAAPNIMILSDDSGSMDWEVMTGDTANGGRYAGAWPAGADSAQIRHRYGCGLGTANGQTFYGYIYGVRFASNTYAPRDSRDCDVAADDDWRFRSHAFNRLYFDPARDYEPWPGGRTIDGTFVPFGDIDITQAPDDPYRATEYIDLTTQNSLGNVDGIGFRYYTWRDLDGDGLFDDGEQQAHLIKDADPATQRNFANWFAYHRSRAGRESGACPGDRGHHHGAHRLCDDQQRHSRYTRCAHEPVARQRR